MKITHIKKLCKEAHMCMIYETGGDRQWIGTLEAIYPVDDIYIHKGSIKTLFDMPDAESDMEIGMERIDRCELAPEECDIDLAAGGWIKLEMSMPVIYLGEKVIPLVHAGGMLFVQEDYIKPAIRKNDYLEFYMARNCFGHPLIMISNGMFTTGIARPLPEKTTEKILETLGRISRFAPDGSPEKNKAGGYAGEINGQMSMEDMAKEG